MRCIATPASHQCKRQELDSKQCKVLKLFVSSALSEVRERHEVTHIPARTSKTIKSHCGIALAVLSRIELADNSAEVTRLLPS